MVAESREGKRASGASQVAAAVTTGQMAAAARMDHATATPAGSYTVGSSREWGGKHNASDEARTDHAAAVASAGRTGSGSALSWTVGVLEWVEITGCL
jgi:hypothetical protein